MFSTVKYRLLLTLQVLYKLESVLHMKITLLFTWDFDRNMILQAEKWLE